MKKVFLLFILFANAALATELKVGSANPEQFRARVALKKDNSQDPLRLQITTQATSKKSTLKFKHSISDFIKLNVSANKEGKEVSLEMLLVVLSSGDKLQTVQMFIPVRSEDFIIPQKMSPVCSFTNHGDFSWIETEEVLERVRINSEGTAIEIKLGTPNQEGQTERQFIWKSCFSISNK